MGVEFILADHGRREFFDLGKGPWLDVFPLFKPFTLNETAEQIGERTFRANAHWCDLDYCLEVACKIVAWANRHEIEMFSDACEKDGSDHDEDGPWNYRESGTRYRRAD